ncbi:hypothetical protein [Desulfovibrio subterraneus]|uniref:hypothetical protein n=1 Tax=Desulfovibrio subterraneus TaxID=2718620 RepID=UPI001FB10324|nr:hypothetical protein [Desulfovibrio subterraneus]
MYSRIRCSSFPAAYLSKDAIVNFKESVIYAIKRAHREKTELVVGKEENHWVIRELSDPKSDMLSPSIIVTGRGIKYPDHEDLYARLVAMGA